MERHISSPRFGADQAGVLSRQQNSAVQTNGALQLVLRHCKEIQTIEYVNSAWTTVDNKTYKVYLKLKDGQKWTSDSDIVATVGEIRTNTTADTLESDYDICIAGSGSYKAGSRAAAGGRRGDGQLCMVLCLPKTSLFTLERAIGGNAMVMVGGELTGRNEDGALQLTWVYSRSAYGKSQDGKTLYVFTIDKSTDPGNTEYRQAAIRRLCVRFSSSSAHGTCATSMPAALPQLMVRELLSTRQPRAHHARRGKRLDGLFNRTRRG